MSWRYWDRLRTAIERMLLRRVRPRPDPPTASARLQHLSDNFPRFFAASRGDPASLIALSQRMMLEALLERLNILLNDPQQTLLEPELMAALMVRGPLPLVQDPRFSPKLMELVALDGSLVAASQAASPQKRSEIVVGAIAAHGARFSEYVTVMARHQPQLFGDLARAMSEVTLAWMQGRLVTQRADELEARARYALEVLEREPRLARVVARQVLALPPGHRRRLVERIRAALEQQLRSAIDFAAEEEVSDDELAGAVSQALGAMAGLLEHELVSTSRAESLLTAGRDLLASPHERDGGASFRRAAFQHLSQQAQQAAKSGEAVLAERNRAEAVDLLAPLAATETDPTRRSALALLLEDARGGHEEVARTAGEVVGGAGGRLDPLERTTLSIEARRALQARDYARVITLLAPQQAAFEEAYLGAVLDLDVATAGEALDELLSTLCLAYAAQDKWADALRVLDRGKSLRFRYQVQLRAGVGGDFVRELEADIQARARGLAPRTAAGAQRDDLTNLLETYRQLRQKLGAAPPAEYGIDAIAAALAPDEAVVVLGESADALLLAVIRSGDAERPSWARVLPAEDARRIGHALVDARRSWLLALGRASDLVDPPRALEHITAVTDRVIGGPLTAALRDEAVRRLTFIPHRHLHLIPFWALPSLSHYEVMTAPSAALFVGSRASVQPLERRAVVVGNPTGDLQVAAAEAHVVTARLAGAGYEVDLLERSAATEAALTEAVAGASIFHFSGHGRSDLHLPGRSALEVHAAGVVGEAGADPLLAHAAGASWQSTYRLAGTSWVHDHTERYADLPDGSRLVERRNVAEQTTELRYEHGVRATVAAIYEWPDEDAEGAAEYGARRHLAEHWTADDILTDRCFRDCQFAFLSSCEAGVGGVGFNVDEAAGLPASLQLAGCASVVSPLWPVSVEAALLFADRFYAVLAARGGEVDLCRLVHRTRAQLRALRREDAAAALRRLAAAAPDPLGRLLLEAGARRLAEGAAERPFAHAYEWAAFHLRGAPQLVFPGDASAPSEPADEEDPGAAMPYDSAPDLDHEADTVIGDTNDVFTMADAAETLWRAGPHEALRELVARAVYDRGAAYRRAGEDERALADFLRVVEVDPAFVDAHIEIGAIHLARGEPEQALIHLDTAFAHQPTNQRLLVLRALGHVWREDDEAALRDLDALLAQQPGADFAFNAHRQRAEVHLRAGRFDAAVEDYGAALALRAEDAGLWLQRAHAQDEAGRAREAVADAARAALFPSKQAAAEAVRAFAFAHAGEHRAAVGSFTVAITFDPERAQLYSHRGLAYSHLGEHDLALADHDRAVALEPDSYEALYNRACAYSLRQEPGSIVADLTAAFAHHPALVPHALADEDLAWARAHLPELRELR